MTQNEIVLNHLKIYGSLTCMEAIDLYGVLRLPARVKELNSSGHVIGKTMESGVNRFGKRTRYARYFMKQKSGQEMKEL